jgi:hypothetical protein
MKHTYIVATVSLLLLLIGAASPILVTKGDFSFEFPVPSMNIISPPYPPNRYENTTVELEINVYLHNDSPKISSISYRLDGEDLQYLKNFTIKSPSNFGTGRVGYTVVAKSVLENLSEGNHTIIAYSNGMSISRTFTVNSSYPVTSIKILSPTNQTYTGEIPLIFTVNGNIEEAYFHLYEKQDYPSYGPNNSNRYALTGNTTIPLPSEGKYELLITLTTEKGRAEAVTNFSVMNDYSMYYFVAFGIGLIVILNVLLVVIRKKRRNKLTSKQSFL